LNIPTNLLHKPKYSVHLIAVFIQGLAAFLKAIGYLIPLMDAEYANYYTREVMLILIREFQSPDEEMKKIVLKVKFSLVLSVVLLVYISV
jgi:hypothetical protein